MVFFVLKAHANGRNKSQHCCVLLGVFGQQCCARLYGPKNLTGFKLCGTSANKCQHCCGSMQTDVTCWAQHCRVLLANNVASVCMGLKSEFDRFQTIRNVPTNANIVVVPCKRRNMLGPTLSRVVGQQYCARLHGPKSFQLVPCKRTQHVGPNSVVCCWPTILRPFAWA